MNLSFKSGPSEELEFAAITGKMPQIFDDVLSMLSGNALSDKELLMLKKDLLFAILVGIMIENGFQPILNEEVFDPGTLSVQQLSKWKLSSGLYEAEFVLLGYSEIPTKLMLTPLATTAIVNAVLPEFVSEVYSICLPIDKYVVFTKYTTKVSKMCCNLKELLDTFKSKILSPVKSKILSLCGYPGPSLMELPEDMFLKIMLYLSISDIISVAMTCKKCNQSISDDNFWHNLFKRDSLNGLITTDPDALQESNWRMCYINSYKYHIKKKEASRNMLRLYVSPIFLLRQLNH